MQSYRHRGWALKMGAQGPDEQGCRFLIYWVGLSAAGTAALCMALHTACSQTPWGPAQLCLWWRSLARLSSPLLDKALRRSCAPRFPQSSQQDGKRSLYSCKHCWWREWTTHACEGLQDLTPPAACCSAALNNGELSNSFQSSVTVPIFIFYSFFGRGKQHCLSFTLKRYNR